MARFIKKIEKEPFVPSQTYLPQIDCEKHKKISGTNSMITWGDNTQIFLSDNYCFWSCHTPSDSHATF